MAIENGTKDSGKRIDVHCRRKIPWWASSRMERRTSRLRSDFANTTTKDSTSFRVSSTCQKILAGSKSLRSAGSRFLTSPDSARAWARKAWQGSLACPTNGKVPPPALFPLDEPYIPSHPVKILLQGEPLLPIIRCEFLGKCTLASDFSHDIQWAPPSAAGPLDYGFWEVGVDFFFARSRQILDYLIF